MSATYPVDDLVVTVIQFLRAQPSHPNAVYLLGRFRADYPELCQGDTSDEDFIDNFETYWNWRIRNTN